MVGLRVWLFLEDGISVYPRLAHEVSDQCDYVVVVQRSSGCLRNVISPIQCGCRPLFAIATRYLRR